MAEDVINLDAAAKATSRDAGGPAGATDPASSISACVAAHRKRKGMRVSALARAVGVSPSLISQIERGQSRPSVSTLFALAEALEVPVDAFFRDSDEVQVAVAAHDDGRAGAAPALEPAAPGREERYVVRRDERAALDIEGGVRWERLTPGAMDAVEFLELVYEPHAESNAGLYRHAGTEMVLVLSGRLDIFVGFERYELGPGDSICFPSTTPHRYLNPTDQTTRAVTVILADGEEPLWNQTRRP